MSLHTTAIHKTICSSDGFFWAASSCKIMNSVCNLLETSRPLFNERSRGWRTEVNLFTAELFSFMDATKFSSHMRFKCTLNKQASCLPRLPLHACQAQYSCSLWLALDTTSCTRTY